DVGLRAKLHASVSAHGDHGHQVGLVGHGHFHLVPHHPQQGIDHFAYEAHRIGAGGSAAVQGADAVPVAAQYGLDGGNPIARLAPVEAIPQGIDEIALHAQVGEVSLYHSVPSG